MNQSNRREPSSSNFVCAFWKERIFSWGLIIRIRKEGISTRRRTEWWLLGKGGSRFRKRTYRSFRLDRCSRDWSWINRWESWRTVDRRCYLIVDCPWLRNGPSRLAQRARRRRSYKWHVHLRCRCCRNSRYHRHCRQGRSVPTNHSPGQCRPNTGCLSVGPSQIFTGIASWKIVTRVAMSTAHNKQGQR